MIINIIKEIKELKEKYKHDCQNCPNTKRLNDIENYLSNVLEYNPVSKRKLKEN